MRTYQRLVSATGGWALGGILSISLFGGSEEFQFWSLAFLALLTWGSFLVAPTND